MTDYPQAVRDALAVNAHIEQLVQALGMRLDPANYGLALNLLTVVAIRNIALSIDGRRP